MNKYIVLSTAALVFSLTVGCQNCGYKTAHSSRYETLVGQTRLESPKTNCRYNTCSVSAPCNACNTCNPCNPCSTQLLANNSPLTPVSNVTAGCNSTQVGLNEQNTAAIASSVDSSLQEAPQTQTAQEQPTLHWRRVTENEQQYAGAPTNPTSAGVASALSAPAFGSPAPASAPGVAPDSYRNDAAAGVASAISRRPDPEPGVAPPYSERYPGRYPGQYSGQYPDRYPGQYSGQYPGRYPGQYSGQYPGQYGGQYGGQYPGQYSGQYSGRTPGQYGGQYPGQYSGQYPSQYDGQYAGQYSGQYSNQYRNSSRGAESGVASAMETPGYPASDGAAQYPGRNSDQYPNSSRRSMAGADSTVSVPDHPLPRQYSNQYPNASPRIASGGNPSYNGPSYGAPSSGADADSLRWRHVTEAEQNYNSPRGSAYNGSAPTTGNSAYAMPVPPQVDSSAPSVPVYQSNNQGAPQTQEKPKVPEIDPDVLPMPESPTGTF